MPSYVTPKRGAAFTFYTALTSQADVKLQQVNPTIAAGDITRSLDGGAFGNLTTLPDVEPDGGATVRVQLSAAEMTADNITVRFRDAVGAQWCDQVVVIQTTAVQIDDLAVPGDEMAVTGGGLTAIAAAVWDRLTTALTTAGSIGKWLLDNAGGGSPALVAAAVWDRLTSALTTAGSVGAYLVSRLAVSLSQPILGAAKVTTIQGDDYSAADGRALIWTVTLPFSLDVADAVAVIIDGAVSFTGAVTAADTIQLELTAAQSASIPASTRPYSIVITQVADGDIVTVVRDTWQSRKPHDA